MKSCFSYIIIVISLFGCSENNRYQKEKLVNEELRQVTINDTTQIFINDEKFRKNWINVISSGYSNTLVFQVVNNKNVTSIAGYGNSEIQLRDDGEVKIDTFDFGNDGVKEYLLSTFIKGSTYGASVNYLVYYDNEWEIFRIPFDREIVRFNNRIKDYVLISYESDGDSTNYKFDSGILTPLPARTGQLKNQSTSR